MQDNNTSTDPGRINGLSAGSHACWFVQSTFEFRSGLAHYITDALRTKERLILLSFSGQMQVLCDFLQENALDGDEIEIANVEEVFNEQRELDPDEMVRRLREVRDEAIREGRSGLRIFMDMGWMSGHRAGVNQVARLCTRIDTLLLEGNTQILAYYDRRDFSPTRLLDILPLYPHVVLNREVVENVYYAAIEDRKRRHRHEAILDHVLARLEQQSDDSAAVVEPFDVESALRMLKTIIDSMGDGVVVVDSSGDMVLLNKAATSVFGYAKSALPLEERVRKFGNYLPDQKTPYPIEDLPIRRAMRGESVNDAEIFIRNERKPEGSWINVNARPLLGAHGELSGGVAVFRDVTNRKRSRQQQELLEARMSQTQKLESLGLLAGGVAHDFNNLLMGILGSAGLALMEPVSTDAQRGHIEDVKRTAVRLSELTSQLLDYSGQGSFVKAPVDVNELLADLQDLLKPIISKKSKIVCNLSTESVVTKADPTQIRQIFMNLITNASEALEGGAGTITIESSIFFADEAALKQAYLHEGLRPGKYVSVKVSDTGVGMNKEVLERIFDPFFTTKVRGRGLGLAAVFGLIRRHKGALFVESAEGVGTTFHVLLPWVEQLKVTQKKSDPIVAREFESGTVLIVDDEEVVRNVTRQMLETSGFEVLTAASGREGIEIFKQMKKGIDAILLDLSMPDMDGREVFRELRQLAPDARVILSSGYSQVSSAVHFPDDALSGFLQKPYAPEVLISKVRQVLEH